MRPQKLLDLQAAMGRGRCSLMQLTMTHLEQYVLT